MRINKIIRMGVAAFGALAIASAAPAGAADLYRGGGSLKDQPIYVPPPMWTGFYIGGHVGGAWNANDDNNNLGFFTFDDMGPDGKPVPHTAGADGVVPVNGRQFLFNNNNNNNNESAVFGGVQFGYNWQNFGFFGANWLAGIEIDVGGFGQTEDNRNFTAVDTASGQIATIRRNNSNGAGVYGDVTGRLGYTWNNTLLYAKGGFAWITNPFNGLTETITDNTGTVTNTFTSNLDRDNILTGWTVGGGIEYMFSQNWTVKVEYLFFDFSNDDRHCCGDNFIDGATLGNDLRFKEDLQFHTVKVGLNYIFNQQPVPLK